MIVIANPALEAIICQTPAQMALVNLLCWVAGMPDGLLETNEPRKAGLSPSGET